MIIFFIILVCLTCSLYGYGYLYRLIIDYKILKASFENYIQEKDLIYGVFFLLSILLLLHFIIALKYLLFLLFVGFFTFIFLIIKKRFKLRLLKLKLFVLFCLFFIVAANGPTYDTQLYHHQILNWNYFYKITFNLALIDERMGMISPWQLFISIGNFKLFGSYLANLFNFIPLIIVLNTFLNLTKKEKNISSYFLILSTLYISFFSLVHPFQNGTILMNVGSLGTDLAGMCFYIMSFFYFFKCTEQNKVEFFKLTMICATLSIFCRISYLPIFFLPIFLLFYNKNFIKNKFNLIIPFIFFGYFLRSLINNSCLIFPVKLSCMKFEGYISHDKIEQYANIVKSFARTAPEYENFMNLDYSINSFNWLIPWFKDYFLITSITQIFLILIIIFSPFFIMKLFNKKNTNIELLCCLIFSINILLWLQAPDVRFALGLIISIPVILICYSLPKDLLIKLQSFAKNSFLLILVFLVFKNYNNYQYLDKKNYLLRNYNYEGFETHLKIEKFKVKKNKNVGGFCYDIQDICKTDNNFDFFINLNKLKYLIIKKN